LSSFGPCSFGNYGPQYTLFQDTEFQETLFQETEFQETEFHDTLFHDTLSQLIGSVPLHKSWLAGMPVFEDSVVVDVIASKISR
jgi:hypothetical protein